MTRCTFGVHRWGKWSAYEETGRALIRGKPDFHVYCETRQKRACELCGYVEDQHIKDGPMHNGSA